MTAVSLDAGLEACEGSAVADEFRSPPDPHFHPDAGRFLML